MKLTEDDLRQLYEESTAPRDGASCLEADALIRAAENRLTDAERETVAGHIACCSECARGYRIARSMQTLAGEPRPRRRLAFIALAATLLLCIGASAWLALLRGRDQETIAALRRALAQRRRPAITTTSVPAAPDPTIAIAELTRPQLDAPIVDLDSDVTRGAAEAARVTVPEGVDLFVTILHLPEPVRGPVEVTIEGPARWSGAWNASSPTATLTLALHRRRFPTGAYAVRTRAGGREASYRFRVDWR